jgi:hypothetical protein
MAPNMSGNNIAVSFERQPTTNKNTPNHVDRRQANTALNPRNTDKASGNAEHHPSTSLLNG